MFLAVLAGINIFKMNSVTKENTSKPENIIYNDKHGVTVSKLSLRVGQALYPLRDITEYKVASIAPNRKPVLAMIGIGTTLAVIAHIELMPSNLFASLPTIEGYGYTISPLKFIEGTGVTVLLIGILGLIMTRSLYALQINMSGNVINTFATRKRDYAKRIAVALGIGR
jgi:hypothetical protein